MKIYLIGMPGAGKSTLGRQLADELMLLFVDLDAEIERKEGLAISEIFTTKGEDYFRQTESETLTEWASSTKGFIMATGGGAPCFYKGIDVMNKTGLSIFLDEPVSELLNRLKSKTDRPLLNAGDIKEKEGRLTELRNARLPVYQQAKIKVSSPDLKKLLEAIHLVGKS